MALPGCIVLYPAIKVIPVVLVDNIAKGANNFHVGLGDFVHHVKRFVE